MSGRRSRLVSGMLAAALGVLALTWVPSASAVGTGNPVIESPLASAKHYNGFTGPFVVNFDDAPFGDYEWFVEQVSSGAGAPVVVRGPQTYNWDGDFARPELTVSALPPGTGYTFWVDDGDGHTAHLDFAVLSGPPPTCSIVLPAQVRMRARYARIPAHLSAECAVLHTTYAAWTARNRNGGFAETFIFSGNLTDSWTLYDDELTGTYTASPNSAKDNTNMSVPQNTRRLVMRMDSRLSLGGRRVGRRVTLHASLTRYAPLVNHFRSWTGRKVAVSYRSCPSCSWHRLKVRTTDRRGHVTFRIRTGRVLQYRVAAGGTANIWAPRADYLRR